MINAAIIVAAGRSVRFGGDLPKQFKNICGRPMLAWTVEAFEKAESIDEILVVVAEENLLYTGEKVLKPSDYKKVRKIVVGGESRQESVYKGLQALPLATNIVTIHDGARPLVRPEDINSVVAAATRERAAILATKVTDTIKRVRDSYILNTIDREGLYKAQTPQAFQYDLIIEAHRDAAQKGETDFTDDAQLIEKRGFKVTVVESTSLNLKITHREDILTAEKILENR